MNRKTPPRVMCRRCGKVVCSANTALRLRSHKCQHGKDCVRPDRQRPDGSWERSDDFQMMLPACEQCRQLKASAANGFAADVLASTFGKKEPSP